MTAKFASLWYKSQHFDTILISNRLINSQVWPWSHCLMSASVILNLHVSACVCTCSIWKWYFGLFFPVLFILNCFFFLPTLLLKKDCERAERESSVTQIMFKNEKTKLPLLMAGPDVNRNGKCEKRFFPSDCGGLTLVIVMLHLL